MYSLDTVENSNLKFKSKIAVTQTRATQSLQILSELIVDATPTASSRLKQVREHINSMMRDLVHYDAEYNITMIGHKVEYYTNKHRELKITREYHRTFASDNYAGRVSAVVSRLAKLHEELVASNSKTKNPHYIKLAEIGREFVKINSNNNHTYMPEQKADDICVCGEHMAVYQEASEYRCSRCGAFKSIEGTIFKDEQFYQSESCHKSKQSGYDYAKHYRFWMDRILAREDKKFKQRDLDNIAYVLNRDKITRSKLTCALMRTILKNELVQAEHLNENIPLLVKSFGGQGPPNLDFQDMRRMQIKFDKIMRLYELCNPHSPNKPYYPYFIYKVAESEFKFNPAKLKIINFIHLQKRETVMKNDNWFKRICAMTEPIDDLTYVATDPARKV